MVSRANAIGRAKTAEGLGRAFSPAFRARAWVPKNLARRVLIYWRARPWSARCYGVARQRDRSRQNSRGPRACFLSGISGSGRRSARLNASHLGILYAVL